MTPSRQPRSTSSIISVPPQGAMLETADGLALHNEETTEKIAITTDHEPKEGTSDDDGDSDSDNGSPITIHFIRSEADERLALHKGEETTKEVTTVSEVTLERLPNGRTSDVSVPKLKPSQYAYNAEATDTDVKEIDFTSLSFFRSLQYYQSLIQQQQANLLSTLQEITREQEAILAEMAKLEDSMVEVAKAEAKDAEIRHSVAKDLENFARSEGYETT